MRRDIPEDWHTHHGNLVLLCRWALDEGYPAESIVGIVEKPWNWTREFEWAVRSGELAAREQTEQA